MAFRRHDDEILQPADLADGGGHFVRDGRRERSQDRERGRIGREEIAEPADGEVGNRREGRAVSVSAIRRVTSSVS
jgi:hypothetical protein